MDLQEQRQQFQKLSFAERQTFIEKLSPEAWYYFRYEADITLRPNQILPERGHRYLFVCGGRGGGKDKLACAHLRKLAMRGQKGLMIVAPTYAYLDDPGGMVDSLIAEFPPGMARRVGSTIRISNGVEIALKTTQQNNGYLIGSNISFAWLNELRIAGMVVQKNKRKCSICSMLLSDCPEHNSSSPPIQTKHLSSNISINYIKKTQICVII